MNLACYHCDMPCVASYVLRQRISRTMLPDKDGPGVGGGQSFPEGEDPSVSLFRDYLRLRTVHPEPDYGERLVLHELSSWPLAIWRN